jgi:hypothetical protein
MDLAWRSPFARERLQDEVHIVVHPERSHRPVREEAQLESHSIEPIREHERLQKLTVDVDLEATAVRLDDVVAPCSGPRELVPNKRGAQIFASSLTVSAEEKVQEVEERETIGCRCVPVDHADKPVLLDQQVARPEVSVAEASR